MENEAKVAQRLSSPPQLGSPILPARSNGQCRDLFVSEVEHQQLCIDLSLYAGTVSGSLGHLSLLVI